MSTPDTSSDAATLAAAERVTMMQVNGISETMQHLIAVVAIARRLQGEKAELRHELHAIYHGGMTSDCWKPPLCERAERAEAEVRELRETIARVETALEKSVELQSHYATLLNMHDGGERMEFSSAQAWMERLAALTTGDKT